MQEPYYAAYAKEDVGRLLERLASDDWRDAEIRLSETIVHQGTVYRAAVDAMPLLINIVASDTSPRQHHLLVLMERIVTGYPVEGSFDPDPVEASRLVLQPRMDEAVALALEASTASQIAAVDLLGSFPDAVARWERTLVKFAHQEESEYLRGTARFVLVWNDRLAPEHLGDYEDEEFRDALSTARSRLQSASPSDDRLRRCEVAGALGYAVAVALDALARS
jgi:hypothetical protein